MLFFIFICQVDLMGSRNHLETETVYLKIPCYIAFRRHYYGPGIITAQKRYSRSSTYQKIGRTASL